MSRVGQPNKPFDYPWVVARDESGRLSVVTTTLKMPANHSASTSSGGTCADVRAQVHINGQLGDEAFPLSRQPLRYLDLRRCRRIQGRPSRGLGEVSALRRRPRSGTLRSSNKSGLSGVASADSTLLGSGDSGLGWFPRLHHGPRGDRSACPHAVPSCRPAVDGLEACPAIRPAGVLARQFVPKREWIGRAFDSH